MLLNINDNEKIDDPTSEDLMAMLPEVGPDEYCILIREDEHYIQCYHNDDDTFLLEFREGSADQHFSESSQSVSLQAVIAAFSGYLAGNDPHWKEPHVWEKLEFDGDFAGDDFLTHYVLNGEEFHRIRVGKERNPVSQPDAPCPECAAEHGAFHADECLAEECPRCHGHLQGCDCE